MKRTKQRPCPTGSAGPAAPRRHSRTRAAAVAALALSTTLAGGCGQVSNVLGLAKGSEAKGPASTATADAPTASVPVEKADGSPRRKPAAPPARPKAPAGRTVAAAPPPASTPLVASSPASATIAAPVATAVDLPTTNVPAEPPMLEAVVVVNEPARGDETSPIYSHADTDVTPARLLTKTTSGPLFRNARTDVNTMELVISKGGRVEQVKLTSPSKRMTDMLLLSGAKTWKFQPAMKDGAPVRYRTHYSWESLP